MSNDSGPSPTAEECFPRGDRRWSASVFLRTLSPKVSADCFACGVCGALVVHRDQHTVWHQTAGGKAGYGSPG